MADWTLYEGDCLGVMATLPAHGWGSAAAPPGGGHMRRTPLRRRRSRPRRGQVVSPETIQEVREAAGHECERCGQWHERLEVHHIAERGMGGGRRRDERWNLIALCRACHRDYHEGRIERREFIARVAYRDGWLLDELLERFRELGVWV